MSGTTDATTAESITRPVTDKPAQPPLTKLIFNRKSPHPSAPARTYRDIAVSPRVSAASRAQPVQHEVRSDVSVPSRAAAQLRRHDAIAASYRGAPSITISRSRAASPVEHVNSPKPNGTPDKQPLIVTYASTYPPAGSPNRSWIPADSMDWLEHMSQRRVTEVPEQFAR
jgi:hypothetical protein